MVINVRQRSTRIVLFIVGLILMAIAIAFLSVATNGATSFLGIPVGMAYGFIGWTWVQLGD